MFQLWFHTAFIKDNKVSFKKHELDSHRELYNAIRQGDPQRSRQAMIDHISYSETLIVNAFKHAEGDTVEPVVTTSPPYR